MILFPAPLWDTWPHSLHFSRDLVLLHSVFTLHSCPGYNFGLLSPGTKKQETQAFDLITSMQLREGEFLHLYLYYPPTWKFFA